MDKEIREEDNLSLLHFLVVMDKIIKQMNEEGKHLNVVIGHRNLESVKINSLTWY